MQLLNVFCFPTSLIAFLLMLPSVSSREKNIFIICIGCVTKIDLRSCKKGKCFTSDRTPQSFLISNKEEYKGKQDLDFLSFVYSPYIT